MNINKLADDMLNDIFKGQDIASLDEYAITRLIYDYLFTLIKYDYELQQKKNLKQYKEIPLGDKQIISVFKEHKGVCSAIAQAYKSLLEKVNIPVFVVVGQDEEDIHQFNLVKRGENWSFDDLTLGIISKDKDSYFDYDNLKEKKQTAIGIMPSDFYDFLGIKVNRESYLTARNPETGFHYLPDNIRSYQKGMSMK